MTGSGHLHHEDTAGGKDDVYFSFSGLYVDNSDPLQKKGEFMKGLVDSRRVNYSPVTKITDVYTKRLTWFAKRDENMIIGYIEGWPGSFQLTIP